MFIPYIFLYKYLQQDGEAINIIYLLKRFHI